MYHGALSKLKYWHAEVPMRVFDTRKSSKHLFVAVNKDKHRLGAKNAETGPPVRTMLAKGQLSNRWTAVNSGGHKVIERQSGPASPSLGLRKGCPEPSPRKEGSPGQQNQTRRWEAKAQAWERETNSMERASQWAEPQKRTETTKPKA